MSNTVSLSRCAAEAEKRGVARVALPWCDGVFRYAACAAFLEMANGS
jgi:hypothetical protein